MYTICKCRDRLSATRFEDSGGADKMRNIHHFWRDAAVGARRGGEHDLTTTRNLCRNTEHECCRRQDRRTPGDIKPNACYRAGEARAHDTGHRLDDKRVTLGLSFVELADVGVSRVNCCTDWVIELHAFGRERREYDRAVELCLVEFGGQ